MPKIIIFGDHRRPLWFDPRSRNEGSRRMIFEAAAAARPDLVLDTGDLIPHCFDACWRAFDEDAAIFRKLNIPMEAVPGNHETYGILPRSAHGARRMEPFLSRFPRAGGARWGVRDLRGMRILLLDSNRDALDAPEVAAQELFIEKTVEETDADPSILLMIALWHHPPFTNTNVYEDDRFSASSFLPRLRGSRKLGAIFCGHVHGYERFQFESISLVVTGGGGAHPHTFPRDHHAWRHTPAFDAYNLPHIHYVQLDTDGANARAEVRHLAPPGSASRWIPGDQFMVKPRGPLRP